MSRKSANKRGPSQARRKEEPSPPQTSAVRQPSAAELEAMAAKGLPLTEAETRNRAEALRRAKDED